MRTQPNRCQILHCDIRSRSDLESIPKADWVIDCAANPSVLAGLNHSSSSLQLMENNLVGTLNLIEYCKDTMPVLSCLAPVACTLQRNYPVVQSLKKKPDFPLMPQSSAKDFLKKGSPKNFQQPPLSLYGASKISSELLALEYGLNFNFPVWIDRCGVMAGEVNSEKRIRELFPIGYIPSERPNRYHTLDSRQWVASQRRFASARRCSSFGFANAKSR